MADDHRYDWLEDWLDEDAVERLLSGTAPVARAGDSADPVNESAAPTPSGASGSDEASGAPGPSGTSGTCDASGASGVSGAAGVPGVPRTSGASADSDAPAAAGAPGAPADATGTSPASGGPADPVRGTRPEGHAVPPEAERLVATLRSLVPPPAPAGQPLPGEDAALAAFRAARAAAAAPAFAAVPERAVPEPAVQLGAPATRPAAGRGLLTRWRPVKAALAMALAGCAIGGVAVAAGAGVLPGPFGGSGGHPAAAPSVSAFGDEHAGSASPDGSRSPGGTPSRGPDGSPSRGGKPDGSGSPTPGSGRSSAPADRDRPGDSASPSQRPGRDETDKGDDARRDGTKAGPLATRLCRDYLAAQKARGGVDEDSVRTLERAAGLGNNADLRTFCENVVKAADAGGSARSGTISGTGDGHSGGGQSSGKTGGTGDDGGGWDTPGRLSRLVPPVHSDPRFTVPAPGVTFSDPTAL
ncbi:hypothetical protein [Streptomyces telluris]|uniref:Uncharacterized protein n=1 Tax=Streptomyces telluris TaxID=2720021 RepID=A0A9X2LDS8_9ACTN|nr:hypothetical protein [Streptomyces telluris]MCQ8769323.1 hypothetical protein [Streptomyces telluris]NJP76899.1 hypothetical protein [Streptomyces telluris]